MCEGPGKHGPAATLEHRDYAVQLSDNTNRIAEPFAGRKAL
jgi:hypothetical protein